MKDALSSSSDLFTQFPSKKNAIIVRQMSTSQPLRSSLSLKDNVSFLVEEYLNSSRNVGLGPWAGLLIDFAEALRMKVCEKLSRDSNLSFFLI